MKKILATAATATILVTGAAFGQTAQPEQPAEVVGSDMQDDAGTMQDAVSAELASRGIEADVDTLTPDQLSQIMLVFNDDGLTVDESQAQVEEIIAGAGAN